MRTKLALSTLCESPVRRTGLSTLFTEFVAHARRLFPDVVWLVFAGRDEPWPVDDPGIEILRIFPSNEHPARRLLADHLRVGAEAARRGAAALVTVGFFPVLTGGIPVVMQVFSAGNSGGGTGLRRFYRTWAVNRGLRHAALVITNSAWAKSELGLSRAPVVVSPEGIRHNLFKPDGPSGAHGVSGKYFLWASNFYAYKRVELALAAYAGLPQDVRSTFPFVLVGGDWGGGRARAEAEAARLGISGDVRFLGWVEDAWLPGLYRGALAHVLSTSQETFGRSVLEAMACGCPCVIQELPVLREVAGDCAVYVDFSDTGSASRALADVASRADLRARNAADGVARAGQFEFERLARERVTAILGSLGAARQ